MVRTKRDMVRTSEAFDAAVPYVGYPHIPPHPRPTHLHPQCVAQALSASTMRGSYTSFGSWSRSSAPRPNSARGPTKPTPHAPQGPAAHSRYAANAAPPGPLGTGPRPRLPDGAADRAVAATPPPFSEPLTPPNSTERGPTPSDFHDGYSFGYLEGYGHAYATAQRGPPGDSGFGDQFHYSQSLNRCLEGMGCRGCDVVGWEGAPRMPGRGEIARGGGGEISRSGGGGIN